MPKNPGRPLAPHVQAAIAAGQGRQVQTKLAGPESPRPLAAHVQAAMELGRGLQRQAKVKAQGSGRELAPHVAAAIAAGRELKVQKKNADLGRSPLKGFGLSLQRASESDEAPTDSALAKRLSRFLGNVKLGEEIKREIARESLNLANAGNEVLWALVAYLIGTVRPDASKLEVWADALHTAVQESWERLKTLPKDALVPFLVEVLRCNNLQHHDPGIVREYIGLFGELGVHIEGQPDQCAALATFSNLDSSGDGSTVTMEP